MKTEELKRNGIYLDEPFSNALIVLGYNEGIIPSYTGGQSDYEKRFLSEFANPSHAKIALHNLVLYDKVFLYPYFDNFRIDELQKEQIVVLPNLGPYYSPDIKFSEKEVNESGLLYPALAYLKTKGESIDENHLLQMLRDGMLTEHGSLLMQMYELKAQKLIGRSSTGLETRLKEVKEKLALISPLFDALNKVSKIINASASLGVPALWTCPNPPSSAKILTVKPDDFVIASIYFRELRRIKVNSLSDAIELRKHSAITDFRNEVLEMTDQVKNGNTDVKKIKKRIHKANRALELSDLAGNLGTVITIAGIPALLAIPVVGIVLTFTGASIVAGQAAVKKIFNWALISN